LIQGAGELRVKETDLIAAMAKGLRRIGVEVEEFPDGLKILGKSAIKGGWVESDGDHRVAMSFLIAGLVAEGEIVVGGTECIATSFPDFIPLLKRLMIR
jgi:3-phosphoshikimate 1-carboxyvinyltransferase